MPVEEREEELQQEEVSEETEELESTDAVEEENGDEETTDETPFWMQDDDDEQESSDGEVPEAAVINIKKKLKGKIRERDEEIHQLRQELEQLKASPKQEDAGKPKRPRQADFDTDEEYEEAMDKYDGQIVAWQLQQVTGDVEQKKTAERKMQQIEKSFDDHYERAATLIKDNGINPDTYKKAESQVIDTIETVFPKVGEMVYKELIDLVGEGSEKAMFYIGHNKAARLEFEDLIRKDKAGLKAAIYLGKLTERISGNKKLRSKAPKPDTKHQGDNTGSSNKEKFLLKKYRDAHRTGNLQLAIDTKAKAKEQGIDTKKWS